MEFEPREATKVDPLMGWTGSGDTLGQVQLRFESKEAAIAYAQKHGIEADIFERSPNQIQIKAYADNFRFDRKSAWTH